jgi:hypothetical protein
VNTMNTEEPALRKIDASPIVEENGQWVVPFAENGKSLGTPTTLEGGFAFINSEERESHYPRDVASPNSGHPECDPPRRYRKVGVEGLSFGGERFWAGVAEVSQDGFVVRVDNRLISTQVHGLKYGDVLHVLRQHVIEVL